MAFLSTGRAPLANAGTPLAPSNYGLSEEIPKIVSGEPRQVDLVMIPGSTDEAVVVLRSDKRAFRVSLSGAFSATVYGDLSSYVGEGHIEEGFLSLAFSPDFASDGRVYVYYTQGAPQPTVLSRFQVAGGVMVTAGPGAETRILEVPDSYPNHNGGKILFGDDGDLYLSIGDGGGTPTKGDIDENAQNLNDWRGKILRINVTGVAAPPYYAVPADNPFVGMAGFKPEVWASGFRNPWRMSEDRLTKDIWVGDTGQASWEEVDKVVKGGNFGWDCYEGFVPFEPDGCPPGGFESPRTVYDHTDECAIVGGYVYRGNDMPEVYGWYVYGDFCTGHIWAVDVAPGATSAPVTIHDSDYRITSFAERADGEILVLTYDDAIYLLHNDGDGDGVGAHEDNCRSVSNPAQADSDGDEAGDACDAPGTGNVNCDGAVNSVDALGVLRYSASLPVSQSEPCLDVGQMLPPPTDELMGDVDCGSGINSVDALKILRAVVNLPVQKPVGCPALIGPP